MEQLSEVKTELARIRAAADGRVSAAEAALEELLSRIEELEARAGAPGKTAETKAQRQHTETFVKWLRDPRNERAKQQLLQCESDLEHKDVSTLTGAGGGFGVPLEIAADIEKRVTQLNPFRSLVRVINVSSANFRYLVDQRGETTGWVGETGTRSATATATLRERVPTFGTIYAYPQATEESVADIAFNVQQWITEDVADSFAAAEATAIISGSGTNRPTGILNTTPTTGTDDGSPQRAADVIEYVPSAASPDAITADSLIDLTYRIKERYLLGADDAVAFAMSRSSLAACRKLKDTTNQYLWQPGLSGPTQASLLGFPVRTCDAMPSVGANAFPVIFGNWRRGYLLAVVNDLRITVDDNITTPGYVKYYIRRRLGGRVLNNDCLKALRTV